VLKLSHQLQSGSKFNYKVQSGAEITKWRKHYKVVHNNVNKKLLLKFLSPKNYLKNKDNLGQIIGGLFLNTPY